MLKLRAEYTPGAGALLLLPPPSSLDVVGDAGGGLTQQPFYRLRLGFNTVGRGEDNDWVIGSAYPEVSRRHLAVLVHRTGGAELFDMGSLNGTLVNGLEARGAHLLRAGDVIRFGGLAVRVWLRRGG